jgi:hypothetical protein
VLSKFRKLSESLRVKFHLTSGYKWYIAGVLVDVSVVYRWYIAMFLATMLGLYPNLSGVVTPWSPLSQAEDQSDKVGLMNHG